MSFPLHITNDNFMYNSMLASALAQLLPPQERHVIRCWIDKLHSIEDVEIQTRNDYMWFLLLLLQNKRIIAPFNMAPTDQPLSRLTEAVPPLLYDEVLKNSCGSTNLQWIDQVLSRSTSQEVGDSDFVARTSTNAKPSEFLQNQPIPKNGIICYMGAFSDQTPL